MLEIGGMLLERDEVAVAQPTRDITPARTENERSEVS
jgi:hypothetical protein